MNEVNKNLKVGLSMSENKEHIDGIEPKDEGVKSEAPVEQPVVADTGDDVKTAEPEKASEKTVTSQPKTEPTVKRSHAFGWAAVALVAGAAIGYSVYGATNNQIIVSGGGVSITKADMANRLTKDSNDVVFETVKSAAMQKFYPQSVLATGDQADKALEKKANKLIDTYIKANGGEKELASSLKAQNMTVAQWKKAMLSQAEAQVKSQAQADQAIAVVKDAKVVTPKQVKSAVKDYRLYNTDAYLVKNDKQAKIVEQALKDRSKVDAKSYEQHQNNLKVSTVDNNSDSTEVLTALKGAKKGDVKTVKLQAGGIYVFLVHDVFTKADYEKANDDKGVARINKQVKKSLNEQAALESSTLSKAEAKVLKEKGVHFKDGKTDKAFYNSLKNTSNSSTQSVAQ